MSNLCKANLCSTVQSLVSNVVAACSTTDILFSTVSIDNTEPTNRISKIAIDDLPAARIFPNGHVAFIDEAKVPVIASNCSWIGFDGRTLGTYPDNPIWAWGRNICGVLGDGTTVSRCSPVREFCSATDWCAISLRCQHSAAIKTSGQLWSWGYNGIGRLGDGTTTDRCSPVREFCSATDWCGVSAGGFHTAAIKTSGELWAWGCGGAGRLGDGTTVSKCSPVRERCSATDWCQVSAGGYSVLAIKTSGQLWAWGSNFLGMLGDGTGTDRCSPVREFCSAMDWCGVSAGYRHTAAVKTNGQIWVWGWNASGRLGDGSASASKCSPVREFCSATDWCGVSAGQYVTAAIKTSGQLWSWGTNAFGGLGFGSTTPISVCSPIREFCSATDWCGVSAGGSSLPLTAAVKTTGQLWAWGYNGCGRLGDGTVTSRCSPVRERCCFTEWCSVSAGVSQTIAIFSCTFICR